MCIFSFRWSFWSREYSVRNFHDCYHPHITVFSFETLCVSNETIYKLKNGKELDPRGKNKSSVFYKFWSNKKSKRNDQMSNIRSSWSQCHIHGNIILQIHRVNEPFKPSERAEIELFRELLLKILASSRAEIWPFWPRKHRIFHDLVASPKCHLLQIKITISQLQRKLKSTIKAL